MYIVPLSLFLLISDSSSWLMSQTCEWYNIRVYGWCPLCFLTDAPDCLLVTNIILGDWHYYPGSLATLSWVTGNVNLAVCCTTTDCSSWLVVFLMTCVIIMGFEHKVIILCSPLTEALIWVSQLFPIRHTKRSWFPSLSIWVMTSFPFNLCSADQYVFHFCTIKTRPRGIWSLWRALATVAAFCNT